MRQPGKNARCCARTTSAAWPSISSDLRVGVPDIPGKFIESDILAPFHIIGRMSPYNAERRDVLENTPPKERDFPKAEILHPELLEIARGQSLGVFPCTLPREQGVYWLIRSLKIISLNMPSLLPGNIKKYTHTVQ